VAIASFRVIGTSPSSCNHRVQDNRFFAKDGSTARMTGRRTSNWFPLITDSMRTAPAGCLAREPAWSRSPLSPALNSRVVVQPPGSTVLRNFQEPSSMAWQTA